MVVSRNVAPFEDLIWLMELKYPSGTKEFYEQDNVNGQYGKCICALMNPSSAKMFPG